MQFVPLRISPHDLIELVPARLRDPLRTDTDARVREEDVQPAVLLQRLVHDAGNVLLLPGVHFPGMNVHCRVERVELPLVRFQVRGVVVADEDGFGAVPGELVDGGTADADGRVGAGDDNYFVFCATVRGRLVSGFGRTEWDRRNEALSVEGNCRRVYVRPSRIACYCRNLGDVFEHAWILFWFGELLAESLYSCFGCG